jgi:toxin ParE1/3/4
MIPPLVVVPEAEAELGQAVRHFEAVRSGLGLQLLGAVEQILARIAVAPGEFAPWPEDRRYRRAVVNRFPFLVVFEERTDTLEVVAIVHAHRGPDYLTRRLP